MNVTFEYQCCECGRRYTRDQVTYLCPVCSATYRPGMPLKGVLRAEFDYAAIRRTLNPHRVDYALWNAVEADYFPPCAVGNTPFTRIDRFGALAGFANVWAKNDGLNPSGSLKDRASVLVAAEARRTGAPTLVAASTGNAASSLAAVCAAAGLACIIFVPATAPRAKLVQMLIHGARVLPINGTYDDAFRLSLEYTAKYGGLNRNTAYHPLTIEGKKNGGPGDFPAERRPRAGGHPRAGGRRGHPQRRAQGLLRSQGIRADRENTAADCGAGGIVGCPSSFHRDRALP